MKTKHKLESISSGQSLLSYFYRYFSSLQDSRASNIDIPLGDALMSSYAMFSLKFPSLLKFEEEFKKKGQSKNLQSMFGVQIVPSDTQMRAIIDEVPTSYFNKIYVEMFRKIQREKKLEPYEFIRVNGVPHYLMIADGTEFFSSKNVCCSNCNVKTHKKTDKKTGEIIETKSYHHQMLNVVIGHPNIKTVIPMSPEPITKQDGIKKCDCELNALKRFLKRFRKDHPKLKVILVVDALYATGSMVRLLKQYEIKYILNVKPAKNKELFRIVDFRNKHKELNHSSYCEEIGEKIKKNVQHSYHYTDGVPIDNDSSTEFKMNFLEYREDTNWVNTKKEECEQHRHFSWVTDITLNKENIETIMQGGRARWCIENEVFNTLKNQGYNYEHNFGHGRKNLSNNFAVLMMLSFFFDQILEFCSKQYKKLLKAYGRKSNIWERFRFYYQEFLIGSWNNLVEHLIKNAESLSPLNSS